MMQKHKPDGANILKESVGLIVCGRIPWLRPRGEEMNHFASHQTRTQSVVAKLPKLEFIGKVRHRL